MYLANRICKIRRLSHWPDNNQSVFCQTFDPRSLQPNSIINSTQVANVRVESRGRGAQNEAQAMGWLGRFFNTVTPF